MKTIDLNADVGEGFATDAELIPLVTSANIACGGHAGDANSMTAAVRAAVEAGIAIGAHPGHEDPEHFGRRELPITPKELKALLERQVDRLHATAAGLGGVVRYLKPHGALYHQTGRDETLAGAVIDFVNSYHTPLAVLCRGGSALWRRAEQHGVAVAEDFPDRRHLPDGSLAPRSTPNSVLVDPRAVAAQSVRLAGHCDSLCLHGDQQEATRHAQAVRQALSDAGWLLRPFAG